MSKDDGFVDVPGYPGLQAHPDGTIKFLDNGYTTKGGVAGTYRRVSVVVNKKKKTRRLVYVHDIICRTFHGLPSKGQVVLHKNDIKTDCRSLNLKWGTQSENIASAYKNGLIKRSSKS